MRSSIEKKVNYIEVLEKLCEIDGLFRAYFKSSFHDYKNTIKILKVMVMEKIKIDQ